MGTSSEVIVWKKTVYLEWWRAEELEGDREQSIWMELRLCWDAKVLEKFCGWLRGEKIGVPLSPTSTKTRHFGKVLFIENLSPAEILNFTHQLAPATELKNSTITD